MVWISPKVVPGIIILLIIRFRSGLTETSKEYVMNQDDPNKEVHDQNPNFKNKSDIFSQQNWKPIQWNRTKHLLSDRKVYLTKVNVFESHRIVNNTQTNSKQNITSESTPEKALPNLLRASRLANTFGEIDGYNDDDNEDSMTSRDVQSRQRKRYRHSKRVRVIKPPHYLLPPRSHDQSRDVGKKARQFYRVYQTQFTKTPAFDSHSEESTKPEDGSDSLKRDPRLKKVRRRPINYLRPPVITLTTTEHVFFNNLDPKETTPMSFTDNKELAKSDNDDNKFYNPSTQGFETTDRSSLNITRSLNSNDNTWRPIKYSTFYTTEMNEFNHTDQTTPHPVYNNSFDDDYDNNNNNINTSRDSRIIRTFKFGESPVTVYSMNDIFGFGRLVMNEWQPQWLINNASTIDNDQQIISSRTSDKANVYLPNTGSSDFNIVNKSTEYRNSQELSTWPIDDTERSSFTTPMRPLVYSDQVLKSSSFIPDDVNDSSHVTRAYNFQNTVQGSSATLPDIQSAISIQEINAMATSNTTLPESNWGSVGVPTNTEDYYESSKMTKTLISPGVQKAGMSVSKLAQFPMENGGHGDGEWRSGGNSIGDWRLNHGAESKEQGSAGLNNAFNYQRLATQRPPEREVKLHVAESTHFRKSQLEARRNSLLQQNNVIPGEAGSDYPILSRPPLNSRFSCKADGKRYVADVSTGCQVFFMCVGDGPGEPMLCPNGTLFSQDFLVCDWWYNVDCRYT